MSRRYVTIVAGVPRSGTSMMMRMLAEGGLPVLTDAQRGPDVDNPNGYYEFEPVKGTPHDCSWLEQADGYAVKMVHLLLYTLPLSRQYRVIFMRRTLDEVVESQNRMLTRLQRTGPAPSNQRLAEIYSDQIDCVIRHITERPAVFRLLEVDYNHLLLNALPIINSIDHFLEGLDTRRMRAVIDPSLYRARSSDKAIGAAT